MKNPQPSTAPETALKTSSERLALTGFIVAAAIAIALSVLVLQQARRLVAAGDWVRHSQQHQDRLQDLRTALAEAEAAQRDYLITGDAQAQTAFDQAAAEARGLAERLVRSRNGASVPRQQTAPLAAAVDTRLATMADVIAERDARGLEAARAAIDRLDAARQRSALRARIDRIIEEQTGQERTRGNEYAESQDYMQLSVAGLLAALLATLPLLYAVIRRNAAAARDAQEQLASNARRLDLALAASKTGTWDWDIANGRIRWDQHMHTIFGLPHGTFRGTFEAFTELLHPEDRKRVTEDVQRAIQNRSEYMTQFRAVWPDGSIHHVGACGLVQSDGNGNPKSLTGVCNDITRIKQAEEAMQRINVALETRVTERTVELEKRTAELESRSRELERANKQLESFSYSVSHDLRAPLRAVSGFAQILARRHRESLSDEGRHFLDNIVDAATQMGQLIDDLLNYSRLGRSALHIRPVPLQQVLSDAARTLQPRAHDTGGEITVATDLPVVMGDATLLRQIFVNLLDNALKYQQPGNSGRVAIEWTRSGDRAVVSVTDNGIGIAPQHFSRIFEVFQRLHTQQQYPGTGIGLAVVKKALDLQGGKVTVESLPGRGSRFIVTLQLAETAPSPELGQPRDSRAATRASATSDAPSGASNV